jgi:hypothetical protein
MEDKTKLLYEVTRPAGFMVERIYHFTDPVQKSVLWEYKQARGDEVWTDVSRRVFAARRFGDTFAVLTTGGTADHVTYVRIDTSRTPHSWISMGIGWQVPGRVTIPRPNMILESPFEVSFQTQGQEKVTLRVDDSGRVDRNGVRVPSFLIINGQFVDTSKTENLGPDGKPVWPPKPREGREPDQPTVNSPKPGGVSSAIAPTTVESNQPRGHWRQWAGGAGILAILAGWFMFRKRTRAGRTGNTTSSGA